MGAHEKMKILVPLDGSIPGQTSLKAIGPLLESCLPECTLLHVTETGAAAESVMKQLRDQRDLLKALGVQTRVAIAAGRPAEAVVRESREGGYDLIVLSTHGRGGVDRLLLGSVAEEVVRTATVPTLLCRMGVPAQGWERIVVALNGRSGAEEVLEDVIDLARRFGSTVHLLKVGLNLLHSNGYRGVALEYPAAEPTSYLDDVAVRLAAEGIPVTTNRRAGLAASEIAHFAREVDAGLICMTTEGRQEPLPGLDRSVAAEVIRKAPCPVYVRKMSRASCANP